MGGHTPEVERFLLRVCVYASGTLSEQNKEFNGRKIK